MIMTLLKIGPRLALKQLFVLGEIRYGTLVGKDKYQNEYYMNNEETHCTILLI